MSHRPTDSELIRDIVAARSRFVDLFVERRVNFHEGDFTDEDLTAWENAAHQMWRNQHPALALMLPTHLVEDEVSA